MALSSTPMTTSTLDATALVSRRRLREVEQQDESGRREDLADLGLRGPEQGEERARVVRHEREHPGRRR